MTKLMQHCKRELKGLKAKGLPLHVQKSWIRSEVNDELRKQGFTFHQRQQAKEEYIRILF